MKKYKGGNERRTLKKIQQNFFRTQLILIVSLAVFLGVAGTLININFETRKRDQNLQNVAQTIAGSPILIDEETQADLDILKEYLDSLKDSLGDIDVISVVNSENVRIYHSNHALIGTVYDGTIPEFDKNEKEYYAADDNGPSGTQRRAYAAIYNEEGEYEGFVIAVMLMENIREETMHTLLIFCLITLAAIFMELIISAELSGKIKESLLGYEPDVISAMYQIRDNILETLDEGIIAVDKDNNIQFANEAAINMFKVNGNEAEESIVGKKFDIQGRSLSNMDVLIDRTPIKDDNETVGCVCILHNRTEYTKLMEDLAGTRYLVDSMRANNHDFTNKLHVILGLIQMEMYDEATSYIENITIVQRATISKIMNNVKEPAVAALLIGKVARASELNVKFVLREGCYYSNTDLSLPSGVLVTIIGNLIDNAFDAMNESNKDYGETKELLFGIFSKPGVVLITTDDTGVGISEGNLQKIFENGYSTKGEGRGTGLYQVKGLVEGLGGTIAVESQVGIGTSFTVSFTSDK